MLKKTTIFTVLALLVLSMVFVAPVGAQDQAGDPTTTLGITPVLVPDNPDCQDLGYDLGFKPLPEPPNENVAYNFPAPASAHTVTVDYTAFNDDNEPTVFDWVSTLGIDAVIVKGGDNADHYVYDVGDTGVNEAFADTGLHPPTKSDGTIRGISHIEFCYDIEEPETSTITIRKVADPSDGTNFPFTTNSLGDFTLDDADPDDGDEYPNSITFDGLEEGTYTFTELVPDGWELGSIVCAYSSGTTIDAIRDGDVLVGVSIIPAPGDDIVCTFNNAQEQPPDPGTITAHKFNDLNGNGVLDAGEPALSGWTMTLYGGSDCASELASGVTDGAGNVSFSNLTAGNYSVGETPQPGWQNTTDLCQDVTLAAGGSEIVNFGNWQEKPSAITMPGSSFNAKANAGRVTLVWETGTEVDNAGFNLYRALLKDGPYAKINEALIAAQGDAVSGASYSFVDVPDYGTFYYKLEDVDLYGMSALHGPVRVTVARPLRRPLYRPNLPEF